MTQTAVLHVDVLRGRNYPQSDDDPCPCSTTVRLVPYNTELKVTLADPFTTDIQESSNAPFYNASVDFNVSLELERVVLVLEVIETSRQKEPYIMFFASHLLSLATRGRHEEVLPLITTNPLEDPEQATLESLQVTESASSCPLLSIRFHVQRAKTAEAVVDVHADVPLPQAPVLHGDQCLVPADSQYVWVNLTSDPRWIEAFRYALTQDWRDRPALLTHAAQADASRAMKRVTSTPNSNENTTRRSGGPSAEVRTIADVVLKKWCCRRSHELLTRLRFCAEAFNRGEKSLTFTREVEQSYRLLRKERVYLLQELALESLSRIGKCALRDCLDHLWILYATGINFDPAGSRVLAQDARRRVREATFAMEDAAILQSSLMQQLVPSLALAQCDEIATEDAATAAAAASTPMHTADGEGGAREAEEAPQELPPIRPSVPTSGNLSASAAQTAFTEALVEFVGALLDTLTEVELLGALKAFDPAVAKAQQRVKQGVREDLQQTIRQRAERVRERKPYRPGGGIKIEHLDILGRRRKSFQRKAA